MPYLSEQSSIFLYVANGLTWRQKGMVTIYSTVFLCLSLAPRFFLSYHLYFIREERLFCMSIWVIFFPSSSNHFSSQSAMTTTNFFSASDINGCKWKKTGGKCDHFRLQWWIDCGYLKSSCYKAKTERAKNYRNFFVWFWYGKKGQID